MLCDGSAAVHKEFKRFLKMPFQSGTVKDAIKFNIAFFPLPYHEHSWLVTKLLPLIIDQCYFSTLSCKYGYYISYVFDHLDLISSQDKSELEMIDWWTTHVSDAFGWTKDELMSVYDRTSDTHDSEMRTRYMWKEAAHKGVVGTPTLRVNGV